MPYTIAIVGCRDFEDYERFHYKVGCHIGSNALDQFEIHIISGGASGADALAKTYANTCEYQFTEYPADWATHGTAGRLISNRKMAEACDECIAFWDGVSRGTRNMIEQCAKLGKKVTVIGVGDG